jgi:hypothetical protein
MITLLSKLRGLAAIAVTVSLAACAPFPSKESQSVPFDAKAVEFANHSGKSTISGQAFYTRDTSGMASVHNTTYTCAGHQVRLIPYSAYTKQETDAWVAKIRWTDPRPIGTAPYRERTAVCDAQGNFTFDSLPRGKWIVFAELAFRNDQGIAVAGGSVMLRQFTETNGHNSVRVILADAQR